MLDRVILTLSLLASIGSLVALFLALMGDVVVRYLTSQSLGWPSEMPQILFPWLAMGGAVVAAQRGRHILVPLVPDLLSLTLMRVMVISTLVFSAAVFAYLARVCLTVLAVVGHEVYPMTGLTANWAYLAMISGLLGLSATSLTTIPLALRAGSIGEIRDTGGVAGVA